MKKIKSAEIIQLLKEGWELGRSTIARDSHCWLQKKLCCSEESEEIHSATFFSLLNKGIIVVENRRKEDAFWLERYKLKEISDERNKV